MRINKAYLVSLWFVQVKDSIISHGCFLRECSVEHSVVGVRSRLEGGVQLKVWRESTKLSPLTWPASHLCRASVWLHTKVQRLASLWSVPSDLERVKIAGHCDDGCWYLWNRGWDVHHVGWGQGSSGCWREHKNKVCNPDQTLDLSCKSCWLHGGEVWNLNKFCGCMLKYISIWELTHEMAALLTLRISEE